MVTRWSAGVVLALLSLTPLSAQLVEKAPSPLALVGQMPDWKTQSPPVEYSPDSASVAAPEMAADLELFGVRTITRQTWPQQGVSQATLFEMINPEAAYGLFTSQRLDTAQPTSAVFGGDSFRRDGSLYFWQSNYVVQIDGNGGAQDQLAAVLSERILGPSRKPSVVAHLPADGLVSGSEKYVLAPAAIDPRLGLAPDSLGFDFSAEAATALYRSGSEEARLLLLLYPTHHIARQFLERIEGSAGPFIKREGPLLAIVYASSDEGLSKAILDRTTLEYTVTYDENTDPVSEYAQIILTIFKLLGVVLALSVAGGVAFAVIRRFIKARYPDQVFDRYQDIEIIQLKLTQRDTKKELGE
jgi:hypothetical protein